MSRRLFGGTLCEAPVNDIITAETIALRVKIKSPNEKDFHD